MRMTRAFRPFLALGALLFASGAHSAPLPHSYSFVPSAPTNADNVQLRMDIGECTPPTDTQISVTQSPALIDVRVNIPAIACEPSNPAHTQTPRFTEVGTLPAGTYTTRFIECSTGPSGALCFTLFEGSLVVTAVPVRFLIPVASWSTLSLLVLGVFVVGRFGGVRAR